MICDSNIEIVDGHSCLLALINVVGDGVHVVLDRLVESNGLLSQPINFDLHVSLSLVVGVFLSIQLFLFRVTFTRDSSVVILQLGDISFQSYGSIITL